MTNIILWLLTQSPQRYALVTLTEGVARSRMAGSWLLKLMRRLSEHRDARPVPHPKIRLPLGSFKGLR